MYDQLVIDPTAREVSVAGARTPLTPKEFDLLTMLARSPRQVFTRRQLLERVWGSAPEYQDPATVTVHVGRLRQKIERDPDHPRWNGQSVSSGELAKVYGFTDLDGSRPDAWRYIVEVEEPGKPADATGYR